jgi:hypothetical protein
MSRKPKGSGGRNAIAQDLLRDNFEDLDMDPNAHPDDSFNDNSNDLYPQIPPPLSADLLTNDIAYIIMKQSCATRRVKLVNYFVGDKQGLQSDVRSYKDSRNATAGDALKRSIQATSNPTQYYPAEILVDHGVRMKRSSTSSSSGLSGSKRSRANNTSAKDDSHSTKGVEIFGQLEKRERAASASSSTGGDAGAGGTSTKLAAEGDIGSDYEEEEQDEYGLDDDYGVSHVFSDDDGGAGESDDEPIM